MKNLDKLFKRSIGENTKVKSFNDLPSKSQETIINMSNVINKDRDTVKKSIECAFIGGKVASIRVFCIICNNQGAILDGMWKCSLY